MPADTDVAIVGAGPFGLSIAAHLRARGQSYRIVGKPMQSWLEQMPDGMLLKSEGFASNLYDPAGAFTLGRYCAERGIPYADLGLPVRLDVFSAYGLAFQKRLVPDLEDRTLVALERDPAGFALRLDDGRRFTARRVVLAVGITHFAYTPPALADLPADLCSHSADNKDPARLKGREVVVIGAGASAIDLAALLHEAGAKVRLATRRRELEIHYKMRLPRTLLDGIRAPMSGIGPSWRSRLCTDIPQLFRYLPAEKRLKVVRTHLGPAAGWFMKERFAAVPVMLGQRLARAERQGDRVRLVLVSERGERRDILAEHVVAATGYRPDLRRLAFLGDSLRAEIRALAHAPELSAHFESSVPGLYFVGPAAANSFGPVMRFAYGAKFTTPRLARHLARSARQVARRPERLLGVGEALAPSDG